MGLAQLRKSDRILSKRRALAACYSENLCGIPGLTPAPIVDGASYSPYTVRVRDRDPICFCQKMRAKGQVQYIADSVRQVLQASR
jgi:dTDP-4-amino-4,6-dideoxygalactose transaminase